MEDLTRDNYEELAIRMNSTRYPERYNEIISKKCKIRYMLNQVGRASFKQESEYMRGGFFPLNIDYLEEIKKMGDGTGGFSVDELTSRIKALVYNAFKDGALFLKFDTTSFLNKPNVKLAAEELNQIRTGGPIDVQGNLLHYIFDKLVEYAGELNMVICIHTGVWGNINYKNPLLIYDVIERHPGVTFDVYHMGMPFLHECGFLGKNYPNAYLNMCWSYIVSEKMATRGLDEWLDYIPYNKIFAFGGDFAYMPENIWAHLKIAKECFATVFAKRIDDNKITLDEAKKAIKAMFYDNPARVYHLE